MLWEVLAIWTIVIVTVTWFVRDERQRNADAELQRAAAYYAHAPQYRHSISQPDAVALPQKRAGGLTEQQRNFFKAMQD